MIKHDQQTTEFLVSMWGKVCRYNSLENNREVLGCFTHNFLKNLQMKKKKTCLWDIYNRDFNIPGVRYLSFAKSSEDERKSQVGWNKV